MPTISPEPLAYSVPQAARLLGIGKTLCYEAVARGDLPSLRIGTRVVIPREGLERFLASAQSPSAGQKLTAA